VPKAIPILLTGNNLFGEADPDKFVVLINYFDK